MELSKQLTENVNSLELWSQSLVIETPDVRSNVFRNIQRVKKERRGIVEFFADSKSKAHATWKAIVGNEKKFTDILDKVERQGKAAIQSYDRAEEFKRREEQRKLQAKADEAARREREAYEKRAAKLKTPEKKQEALEAAEAVEATVVYVPPTIQKEKGEIKRKAWKAQVQNIEAVPRQWLMINQKAIDQYAQSTKGQVPIPGIRFVCDEILGVKA